MTYLRELREKPWPIVYLLAFLLLFVSVTASAADRQQGHFYRIDPEYERTLNRVLISTDMDTPLSFYMDTIKNLPGYTELLVLLPALRLEDMKQEIRDISKRRKVRLIPFDTYALKNVHAYLLLHKSGHVTSTMYRELEVPRGSVWAQDLFKVARSDDGKQVIIAPDLIDAFFLPHGHAMDEKLSDNTYIKDLADKEGFRVMKTPLTFKGGNLLTDRFGGRDIAFVGEDIIRDTMAVLEVTGGFNKYSRADVHGMIKDYLNVDEVVVMGEGRRQPNQLFHLDQAMIFLSEGVVGVTHLVYDDYGLRNNPEIQKVERFLYEASRKLTELGYRIVNIHTTAEDVLDFRYYTNGIAYTNTRTGEREFLMPEYHLVRRPFVNNIIRRNTVALQSEGYKVIPVFTDVNKFEGGLHCIVNIIS